MTVFPAAVLDRRLNGAAVGTATGTAEDTDDKYDEEEEGECNEDSVIVVIGEFVTSRCMASMLSREASAERSISAPRTLNDRPVADQYDPCIYTCTCAYSCKCAQLYMRIFIYAVTCVDFLLLWLKGNSGTG